MNASRHEAPASSVAAQLATKRSVTRGPHRTAVVGPPIPPATRRNRHVLIKRHTRYRKING
jgi:hypothetical protein